MPAPVAMCLRGPFGLRILSETRVFDAPLSTMQLYWRLLPLIPQRTPTTPPPPSVGVIMMNSLFLGEACANPVTNSKVQASNHDFSDVAFTIPLDRLSLISLTSEHQSGHYKQTTLSLNARVSPGRRELLLER